MVGKDKKSIPCARHFSTGAGQGGKPSVAHTCGESMKGVVGRRVERIEEKPNNMVIRDNRLQNPSEAGNKRAQSLTNTGLSEFRV